MAVIDERIDSDGKVSYRVRIRIKGHPSLSQTFSRKTDAKEWATRTEAAIKEKRYFPLAEARRHSLKEAIERYRRTVLSRKAPSNIPTEDARLRWWEEQLGDFTLDQITPALLTECRDRLLAEGPGGVKGRRAALNGGGVSTSTAAKYLRILAHLFHIAVREWQWLRESPLDKVTKPPENRGRVRFLEMDELKRLLDVCRESNNPYLYTAVVVSISTGVRRGELLSLTWGKVDLKEGHCILEDTKNGTRRSVFLRGEALRLMRELTRKRNTVTNLCFPSLHYPNQPYDIRRPFLLALKRAKIRDFTWHDLRHCCASYLMMNGATLGEVAEVLGHKTLAMVKRYAHIADSHTATVVDKMNRAIFK